MKAQTTLLCLLFVAAPMLVFAQMNHEDDVELVARNLLETPAQEPDPCPGDRTVGGCHLVTGEWWEPVTYLTSATDSDGDGILNVDDAFPLDPLHPNLAGARIYTNCPHAQPGLDCRVERVSTSFQEDGHFSMPTDAVIAIGSSWGDFDLDGDLDLAFAAFGGNTVHENVAGSLTQDAIWSDPSTNSGGFVQWIDGDLDGDLDLFSASNTIGNIFENDAGVLTSNPIWTFPQTTAPISIVLFEDLDADGLVDITLLDSEGGVSIRMAGLNGYSTAPDIELDQVIDAVPAAAVWLDGNEDGPKQLFISYTGARNVLLDLQASNLVINEDWRPLVPLKSRYDAGILIDIDADGFSDLIKPSDAGLRLFNGGPSGFGAFGTMISASSMNVCDSWITPVAGDVDGDGDLDLVCVNADSYSVSVQESNGWSTLGGDDIQGSEYYSAVGMLDFDADGFEDLVLSYDGGFKIIRNNGSQFTDTAVLFTYSGAGYIRDFKLIDFDADGDDDISFSNDDFVYVLENSAGAFLNYSGFHSSHNRAQISWADFDGNGRQDLLVNGNGGAGQDVYFLQTDGTVIVQDLGSGGWQTAITADIHGDGDGGVLWCDSVWDGSAYVYQAGFLSYNSATSQLEQTAFDSEFNDCGDNDHLEAGDIDGDGLDDILQFTEWWDPYDLAYLNDGSNYDFLIPLAWTPTTDLSLRINSVGASDLDGDGSEDVLLLLNSDDDDPDEEDNDILIFAGTPTGLSTNLEPFLDIGGPGSSSEGMRFFDVDGDQDEDLLVLMDDVQSLLLENDDGRFDKVLWKEDFATEMAFLGATATDYDSDGDMDLFLFGGVVTLLQQTRGSNQFEFQVHPSDLNGEGPDPVSIVDIDRDGTLEVMLANGIYLMPDGSAGGLQQADVFSNGPDALHPWRMLQPAPIAAEFGDLCDVDGDGLLDIVYVPNPIWSSEAEEYHQNISIFLGVEGGVSMLRERTTKIADEQPSFDDLTCTDLDGDGSEEVLLIGPKGAYVYHWGTDQLYNLFSGIAPGILDVDIGGAYIAFALGGDGIQVLSKASGVNGPADFSSAYGVWDDGVNIPVYAKGILFADQDEDTCADDLLFWDSWFSLNTITCDMGAGWLYWGSDLISHDDYDGGYISDVQSTDLDADGLMEIVIASSTGFHIGELKSNSKYGFNSGDENTSTDYDHAEWVDIDQDGDQDLLVSQGCCDPEPGLYVHWNTPVVGFQSYDIEMEGVPLDIPAGYASSLQTASDASGDQMLLVLRNDHTSGDKFSFAVNLGGGWADLDMDSVNWTSTYDVFSMGGPDLDSALWGDLDGDGWTDLVASLGDSLLVYPNIEGQLAESPSQILSTEWGVILELADIDGDGYLDLLMNDNNEGGPLELFLGSASGFSESADWTSADGVRAGDMAFADYDGDGDLDLAVGTYPSSQGDFDWNDDGFDLLYRNDGGTLTANPVWTSPVSTVNVAVAWGDIDGDGILELALDGWETFDFDGVTITFHDDSPTRIYAVEGTGLGDQPIWESDDSGFTNDLLWLDVDSDGDLDLVVAAGLFEFGGGLNVYLSEGGVLSTATTVLSSQLTSVQSLLAADFDSNGGMDLLVDSPTGFAIAWSTTDDDLDGVEDGVDKYLDNPTQAHNSDNDPYGDNPLGIYPDSCPIISGESWRDRWGCADEDRDGQSNLHDEFWIKDTQWNDTDGDGFGDNWGDPGWNDSRMAYWPGEYIAAAFNPDENPLDWDNDGFEDPEFEMMGAAEPLDDCPMLWGTSAADLHGCPDADGDGWSDQGDSHPTEPTQHVDSDQDGWGDNRMGVNGDQYPDDASQWTDADGDEHGDNPEGTSPDAYPLDPTQWNDTDGDGFGDNPFGNAPDGCPLTHGDSTKDLLGCHDGDGDGWSNLSDFDDSDPLVWSDSDGDGYPDQLASNISDDCPGQVGASDRIMRGCPDMDGDGMPDIFDDDVDGDKISNSMEREASRGGQDWDPYDASSTPPDFDGDRIPDIIDLDDDDDGFPDAIENERGSDPMDASITPLNMFGEGDTGFYYVPGSGFQSEFSDDGYEISLSAMMSLVTSEYLIPLILAPISLLLILRKRRRFKKFKKRLTQAEHHTELDQLEEDIDDLIESGKIKVEHGLLLRNQYERMREQISSGVGSSSRPPGRRGLAGGGQQSKKGYGAGGGSVMSPPSRRGPPSSKDDDYY